MTALLVASHWVYRAGHRNRTLRQQWIHSLAGAPEKGLFDHLGIASDIEQRHHWFACSNVRSLALVRGRQPNGKQRRAFNPQAFLTTTGAGRKMMSFTKGQTICAQGDAADALFVIQEGQVKLSVKSQIGKEAILDILSGADFVGKDSIAGQSFRTASASAITDCTLLRISNEPMLVALATHLKLANLFWAYVLVRNIRYQQDLVDQHCNPSEKRLARILLLLAHYDGHGPLETTVPKISHETLAEMVGTTRSRICFFMNRFKKSGFIYYEHKGKTLRVHRTLLAFCGQ